MKRGVRPVAHPRDEAVLERCSNIRRGARSRPRRGSGAPDPALPDAAFVARDANGAEPLLFRQRLREPAFDQPPARREIRIGRRQCPDRMQMIRQHDEGINRERMILARGSDSLAQK